MEFRFRDGEQVRTRFVEKDSSTVIPAGSLIALDGSKLAIKAVAGSTAIAYCPNGGADGETRIEATIGNNFSLRGTGDDVFAESMRGTEVDIVGTTTVLIDVGESSTDVLKICDAEDAGVVGSADNIEVRINKPLF